MTTTTSKKVTLSATRDIPFNKLVLSRANVRRVKAGVSIAELAEDIARRTLLSSLTVRPVLDEAGAETGMFEIPAGGRRFRALELLVKQKRLNRTALVPCIVRTDGIAEEDSLAENVQRAPLHPLDQFRAFHSLREKGLSEEEIAAAFFVSPSVVKQRLKLAAVAPALLEAYADEAMTLDQLMAFTVNGDHDRQVQVWEAMQRSPTRQPYEIRRILTEGAVRASDRRAQFVGLAAYEAAGGTILRDLFQADDGGWLQDAGLLETLASEKLDEQAEAIRSEGWRWVEAATDFPYGHSFGMRRLLGEAESLTDAERATFEALEAELATLEAQYDSAEELPEAADARLSEIETALDGLRTRPVRFAPEDARIAGGFVSIDAAGRPRIERGYVRRGDEPVAAAGEPECGTAAAIAPATEGRAAAAQDADVTSAVTAEMDADEGDLLTPLPDRLLTDLTTHRTLALRDALADDPATAYLAALHAMVLRQFYRHGFGTCVEIEARGVAIGHHTRGITDTAYAKSIDARVDKWMKVLPSDADQLWVALVAFDQSDREALFAHCVAMTLTAVHDPYTRRSTTIAHADVLATRVGLDMAKAGWTATADSYLGHVTKARILEALREAKDGAAADRIAGLKKPQMVVAAEELLAGTGWLPEPLRTPVSVDSDGDGSAGAATLEGDADGLENDAEPADDGALDEDADGGDGDSPIVSEPKGFGALPTPVPAEAAE